MRVILKNGAIGFNIERVELQENECADLITAVNRDFMYSGLKIGYDSFETNEIGTRMEFNGTHEYTTDISNHPNILSLISPYRADSVGIEFLARQIPPAQGARRSSSENDVFLVNVRKDYANIEGELIPAYLANTTDIPLACSVLNMALSVALSAIILTIVFPSSSALSSTR